MFESERLVLTLNPKSKKVWFLVGLWVCGKVERRTSRDLPGRLDGKFNVPVLLARV